MAFVGSCNMKINRLTDESIQHLLHSTPVLFAASNLAETYLVRNPLKEANKCDVGSFSPSEITPAIAYGKRWTNIA